MAKREAKQLFLAILANGFSISRAAEAVGLTRQQALDLRDKISFAATGTMQSRRPLTPLRT